MFYQGLTLTLSTVMRILILCHIITSCVGRYIADTYILNDLGRLFMASQQMSIEEAASVMASTSSSAEERRQAAKVMGARGGARSHGGGRKPKR
jgi:hypothetical protein